MLKPTFLPSPNQLFSETPKEKEPPSVPTPAPALTSPVAFSSTLISIIFKSLEDPFLILEFTVWKIFRDFILATDFCSPKFVNGSPSSISNSLLITDSFVIVFPNISTLSTNILFPS